MTWEEDNAERQEILDLRASPRACAIADAWVRAGRPTGGEWGLELYTEIGNLEFMTRASVLRKVR